MPFSNGISLKVNIISWLEFELTYYNITAQNVSNYTKHSLLYKNLNVLKMQIFQSVKKIDAQ